ncbi:MAG TPA: DEAD/DEAH box helicase [Verrucomicrobiae bacterium]|nr:DEAD/DEAH box helicase [Verrucomicrobiae bacterium]
MFALHACWLPLEGICLWGEDPTAFSRAPAARGPTRAGIGPAAKPGAPQLSASARPRVHPFAAPLDRLAEAIGAGLAEVGEGCEPDGLVGFDLRVHLPTDRGRPQPSASLGELVTTPLPNGVASELRPWWVPALVVAPSFAAAALEVLARPGSPLVGPAPSVAFAAHLREAALDLVRRGRLLPSLRPTPTGGADGRWIPLPTGADRGWLHRLAAAMPPAFAATAADPDQADRLELVEGAVAQLVDAAARQLLGGLQLVPIRHGASRGPEPALATLLAALVGADPSVEGGGAERDRLAAALDGWASSAPVSGPLRTCFRLTAPDEPGDELAPMANGRPDWRLELLLQSHEDPSLLVPAADVWAGQLGLALGAGGAHPEDQLLADLARAARLWPPLGAALEEAVPERLPLDATGAHEFLLEAVPALEDAGFGVMVPSWWRSDRSRLGLRIRARAGKQDPAAAAGLLGLDSLCAFRVEVALGDETLDLKELHQLAAWKGPLVQVRGRWVELALADVARALAALERLGAGAGKATARELLQVGVGLGGPDLGLPVVGIEADGWLGQLLTGGDATRVVAHPAPAGFAGVLRPYQERGLGWLEFLDRLGLGGCLADDMGLGKTIQLLALLAAERVGAAPRLPPTLLVAPMSVVGNWEREARRFTPTLRVVVHHGTERAAGAAFRRAIKTADLVLTTYGLVLRDQTTLAGAQWHRLVLDEAQAVKNPDTKQARAVRAIPAARRFALTGTPVENRLADLHSLMDVLNPGLLGSRDAFRRRFAVPIERDGDEAAAERLRRLTAPFVLRRRKLDPEVAPDLPAKLEMREWCNLTREQASLYQAVVDDMLERIEAAEGVARKGRVLAGLTRLKQVCNHPAHLLGDGSRLEGRSGKLSRLEGILGEVLAEGERALCFTQFVEMGRLLVARLELVLGRPVAFLHGGLAKRARDELVTRFQAPGGPPVLVASLKAGGVGLNLTAANHVVHFDRWWNAAVEDQATDRAFRIGQTRQVQVRKLVCVGTLEERIDQMIERKRGLAERIVGAGDGWLTELSSAELRRLVALDRAAVQEA